MSDTLRKLKKELSLARLKQYSKIRSIKRKRGRKSGSLNKRNRKRKKRIRKTAKKEVENSGFRPGEAREVYQAYLIQEQDLADRGGPPPIDDGSVRDVESPVVVSEPDPIRVPQVEFIFGQTTDQIWRDKNLSNHYGLDRFGGTAYIHIRDLHPNQWKQDPDHIQSWWMRSRKSEQVNRYRGNFLGFLKTWKELAQLGFFT